MREFVYYSKNGVTAGNMIGDNLMKAGRTSAQSLCGWKAHASHGGLTSWMALRYNRRVAHCFAMDTCSFEGGFTL